METMETMEIQYPYLDGKISLVGQGQQDIKYGDKVKIQVTVSLPMDSGTKYLPKSLRFGERITVCDQWMHQSWGAIAADGATRDSGRSFYSETWQGAQISAKTWAEGELEKLRAAIDSRAAVLHNAGPWI